MECCPLCATLTCSPLSNGKLLSIADKRCDEQENDQLFDSCQRRASTTVSAGHLIKRTHYIRISPCCLSFMLDVRMFDHIDQPPQVPLYPAKRPLHPRRQWISYSMGHSPDVGPNLSSPLGLPPPQIPPSRTFNAQGEDPYLSSSINHGGERGGPVSTPCRSHARVGIPVSGSVEPRGSIHPYDHNGAGGWRASEVGNTARNDAVEGNAQPPLRRLSSGRHAPELRVHAAVYPPRQYDPGHGGEARVQKSWSRHARGEWNTDTSSSAAAAAASAAPGGMIKRGCRGPAWGGEIGGSWN